MIRWTLVLLLFLYGWRLLSGHSVVRPCQGYQTLESQGWIPPIWPELNLRYVPLWVGDSVCSALDCGSVLSVTWEALSATQSWNNSAVYYLGMKLNCSDSVRLVPGQSLDSGRGLDSEWRLSSSMAPVMSAQRQCSGLLQIRDQHLNQSWTEICEGALDHQGAEVLCRELGCGPPLLQGVLSPLEKLFHCEGHESGLMDCHRTQTRTRSGNCSAHQITCSEPLRLVGGASRCEGKVEVKVRGNWGQVVTSYPLDLEAAATVCQDLNCGSAVSAEVRGASNISDLWKVQSDCLKKWSVRECVSEDFSEADLGLQVVCSDLLNIPEVSVSEGEWAPRAGGGVWVLVDADFWVKCSVEPQYPGGSFTLLSPTLNHTQAAVNHSAHFQFCGAGPAHRGSYTCVYHLQVFNHSFSSNSSLLIYQGDSGSRLLMRALVLLLLHLLYFIPYIFYRQAIRGLQETQGVTRRRAASEEENTDRVVVLL